MKEKTRKQGPSDKVLLDARPEEIMLNSDAFLKGKWSMVSLPVSAALKAKYKNIIRPGQSKTVRVTCAVAFAQVEGCTDLDIAAFFCPPPEGRERISITGGMFDVGQVEVLGLDSDEPTKLHLKDDVTWTEWDRDVSEIEHPMKSEALRLGKQEGWCQLGTFTKSRTKYLKVYCKYEGTLQIKASETEAGTAFVECTPPVVMMLAAKSKSASGGMGNMAAELEQGEAMTDGRLRSVKICVHHKEL